MPTTLATMTNRSPRRGAPAPSPQTNPVTQALDVPRLTLDDLAGALGTSRASLEKYRLPPAPGRQRVPMPEAVRLRLAAFLEGHAARLLNLADELRALTPDA